MFAPLLEMSRQVQQLLGPSIQADPCDKRD
mgnify:CR=1 FL=1